MRRKSRKLAGALAALMLIQALAIGTAPGGNFPSGLVTSYGAAAEGKTILATGSNSQKWDRTSSETGSDAQKETIYYLPDGQEITRSRYEEMEREWSEKQKSVVPPTLFTASISSGGASDPSKPIRYSGKGNDGTIIFEDYDKDLRLYALFSQTNEEELPGEGDAVGLKAEQMWFNFHYLSESGEPTGVIGKIRPLELENYHYTVSVSVKDARSVDLNKGVWIRYTEDGDWEQLPSENYKTSREDSYLFLTLNQAFYDIAFFLDEPKEQAAGQKALLFYSVNSNLKKGPEEDAVALKETLMRTDQYDAQNIFLVPLDFSSNQEAKNTLLETIREELKDNTDDSLSFIYYSGHGSSQADGTSSLAVGNTRSSYVSASELRTELTALKGNFFLMIDACFSGGMINSINTFSADAETDPSDSPDGNGEDGLSKEELNQFSEGFVREFRQISKARSAYGSDRFRILTAASNAETSIQFASLGGQLTYMMNHAMGYDRIEPLYHTYAADINGDFGISMKELSNFSKKQGMLSAAVVFPENSTENVFTYEGIPASFDMDVEQKKIIAKKTDAGSYEYTLPVKVTNLTDEEQTLSLLLFDERMLYHFSLPGISLAETILEGEIIPDDTVTLASGETKTITLTSYWAGREHSKQVWCRVYSEEDGGAYLLGDFTLHIDEKDAPDKESLQIKSPYRAEEAQNAQTFYLRDVNGNLGSMPVTVQFDKEPTDKIGKADMKLSLEVYSESGAKIRSLYKDHIPSYARDERLDSSTEDWYNSTYSFQWDFADDDGNYIQPENYRIVLTCRYGDGDEKQTETWIQVEAEGSDYILSEFIGLYRCPLSSGESLWKSTQRLLDMRSPLRCQNGEYAEIEVAQWRYYDENGDLQTVDLDSEDAEQIARLDGVFIRPNGSYISQIRVEIPDGAKEIFSPDCSIIGNLHEIENIKISADGKILTYDMLHNVSASDPEQDIQFIGNWAAGETAGIQFVPDKKELQLFKILSFDSNDIATTLTPDDDGIFEIPTDSVRITYSVRTNKIGFCGISEFSKTVTPAELFVNGPDLCSYVKGRAKTLELSGGYVILNGKKTELTPDMLEGWDDAYLNQTGTYPVSVRVGEELVKDAFTVSVSEILTKDLYQLFLDSPGLRFSYRESGQLDPVPESNYKNIVLILQRQDEQIDDQTTRSDVSLILTDAATGKVVYPYGGTYSFFLPFPKLPDKTDKESVSCRLADDFSAFSEAAPSILTDSPFSSESSESEGFWIQWTQNGSIKVIFSYPVAPDKPGEPDTPDEPDKPSEPDNPGEPDKPGKPQSAGSSSDSYNETGSYNPADWQWSSYVAGDGSWVWKYRGSNGDYVKDGWYLLTWNGRQDWYRFDADGRMQTGWFTDTDGRTYYLNPVSDGTRGAMATGWRWIDGKACYFKEAAPYSGEFLQDYRGD